MITTPDDFIDQLVARYRALIHDLPRLRAISATPLPTTVWVNPLRAELETVNAVLTQAGYTVTPMPWHPAALTLTRPLSAEQTPREVSEQALKQASQQMSKPCSGQFQAQALPPLGTHWSYRLGWIHIQEAVSMLPGLLLPVQPGECVLDLCAAPGNKTAQLALRLNQTGTVIANDREYQRMRAIGQMIKRLGLMNITTTVYDGRHFPGKPGSMDHVLVDAPCSCEGTYRKKTGGRPPTLPTLEQTHRLAETQGDLLTRALRLCRPGGTILYSTCTFSPIENEQVVNTFLNRHSDQITLIPLTLPHIRWQPGCLSWEGQRLSSSLALTRRVWPHDQNTGGFFLALFQKKILSQSRQCRVEMPLNDKAECERHPGHKPQEEQKKPIQTTDLASKALNPVVRVPYMDDAVRPYLEILNTRFGIDPVVFQPYSFFIASRRGLYICGADHVAFPTLKIDSCGLFFMKTQIRYPKLTTAAAMLWGRLATRHKVQLTDAQREAYLNRQTVLLTAEQCLECHSMGYVLVQYQDHVIGQGVLHIDEVLGGLRRLQSFFPKYY